jgi:hypothetical protein
MFEPMLPLVQPETCFSIEKECMNVNDIDLVKKLYKQVKKKNPVIATWINAWAKKTKDRFGAMACALIVYRLLESQDEADMMNELL